MTISKRIIAVSVTAIMMSLILAPVTKVYATSGSVSGSIAEAEAETVTESEDASLLGKDFKDMTRDELIEFTRQGLEQGVSENDQAGYTFEVKDDCVIINMWYTGADEALAQLDSDPTAKEGWSYLVGVMEGASYTYYEAYKLHDMDVYLSLVNDSNHEQVLITARNGEIIYDYVNGIDKTMDYNR